MLPSDELTAKMSEFLMAANRAASYPPIKGAVDYANRLWQEIVAEIRRPEPYSEDNLPKAYDYVLWHDEPAIVVWTSNDKPTMCDIQSKFCRHAAVLWNELTFLCRPPKGK